MSYAELHCVSNFTFLRGASHPFELVRQAKALGYAALAITDECSLASIVRAHEAAQDVGLKLVVGSEFHLNHGTMVLLAPTQDAYSQICEFVTGARRSVPKGGYQVSDSDFASGLSRCLGIWIPAHEAQFKDASWFAGLALAGHWLGFGHHLQADAQVRLERITEWGTKSGTPVVAVNSVHYHVRERRKLQDTLTAIRLGRPVTELGLDGFPNGERFLRPISTLEKLYPSQLLQETLRIADRCRFSLDSLRYEYPHELVPKGLTPVQHLRTLTEQGMQHRWPDGVPAKVRQLVERELALIAELGYEHYFLTVEDLVRFARAQGILCQGRGSAANSAVCYALGVTEVDPARIDMLFERFISKERSEPPDIDIDFEHQRREEVIQYVYSKYGRERAALAATVICYRPRSAIRDVGKALGLPLDQVDRLAKSLYWFDKAEELPLRLQEIGLSAEAPLVRQMFELVNSLIGFPRHLSQHVGGFVISHHPLSTLVPVENAAMPDRTIIQWDKEDLEALGLLKVDCLALGMLSAIRDALQLISKWRGEHFGLSNVPPEDAETYEMLCRRESTGVFQVESRAQMSMLPRLQPRNFYDLVIEVAIVRPGPIQGGMVHPYLQRRQNPELVEYPSEALKRVLEKTLGVPLFQEQVMQIAIVAAGFTPGEADHVRRSMAAWQRRGGLQHFREKLLRGMAERGYTREFAERIYQQILGFGSYGFPESHAASFALLVYVSAWLKRHEPAAFCAGLLNAQPMGFYAPAQLVADARRNGVTVLPPTVEASQWNCALEADADGNPAVRLGLRQISGLPETEGKAVVAARSAAAFRSIDDLAHRAKLTRKALNRLADAGALSGLSGHRHQARWAAQGVEKLPVLLSGHSTAERAVTLPEPSEGQDLVADYRSLGLTLGRHPLALLRPRLARLRVHCAADLKEIESGQRVRVAGLVTHRQRPETASGVMFASIEDETGTSNLIIWPSVQGGQRKHILGASLMIVSGELQNEQGVIHVIAEKIRDYSHWLGSLAVTSRDFR